MTENQYDENLSDAYTRTKEDPSPLQILSYQNFTWAVSYVDGLDVCDLGCGAGHSTRLLRTLGAPKRLVGADVSSEMISKAVAAEKQKALGIDYHCVDCTNIPDHFHGQFDLATAMWLLHYAESREALAGFATSIASILRPNGRFVTVVQDKFAVDHRSARFGEIRTWVDEAGCEGNRQRIIPTGSDGSEICSFVIHCWSRDAYTQALRDAGFQNIEWQDLVFDQMSRDRFDDWRLIESLASCSLLTARL